jgi:hypothetical protein
MSSHDSVHKEKYNDGGAGGDYVSHVSRPTFISDAGQRVAESHSYDCAEKRTHDDLRIGFC